MAVDSVEITKCPWCKSTLRSSDSFEIIIGDLPSEPYKEGHGKIVHCICYDCGQEWVE